MTDDDDDLDGMLFDEVEETPGDVWNPNCLVVNEPCATPEDLNEIEAQFRMNGKPPVMFVGTDDNGRETFENPETFAKAMKLPAGTLPTMEEADAWNAAGGWRTK